MNLNKLLERQLKKYLPGGCRENKEFERFLQAVSESYNAYERDSVLAERAFSLSESEYERANEKIREEAALKNLSIARLRQTIARLEGREAPINSDNLLDIVEYLELQVAKRKTAEQEASSTANMLVSLIDNLQAAVLVEDKTRHIVFANQQFCDLFNIPVSPDVLRGADCSQSAEQSKHLFKDPVLFTRGIEKLVTEKKLAINEELEMADGRFVERDYIPIFLNEEYKGHFWKYRDITARKKAEIERRANEELMQFALEGAGDCVWQFNYQTLQFTFGGQFEKMLGIKNYIPSPKGVRADWVARSHPDDTAMLKQLGKNYRDQSIKSHHLEYRILHESGEYIWILDRGTVASYLPDGSPEKIVGTHADITKNKKAEEELRRLSMVASANKNAVLFTDIEGRIFWHNEGFSRLTGFTDEEIIGKTPIELLSGPKSNSPQLDEMIELFLSGRNFEAELLCYKKDGSAFWGKATGQSIKDAKGNLLHFFAMLEDVTKEKEAQEKLLEFNERFRTALEKIGDEVWEHDYNTGKTWFSKNPDGNNEENESEAKDRTGDWWKRVHPDDVPTLRDNDEKYRSGLIDHHVIEYRMIGCDGVIRWVIDKGVVTHKNPDGSAWKVVGTHLDITERRKKEQTLRINEEKYRNIIANMHLGLIEVDLADHIKYANQSFCEMSGFDLTEIMNKRASTLFLAEDGSSVIDEKSALRKKGISDLYELPVRNKSGDLRWWLISGAPRYDDKGALVGSIGIHLDITQQKKLELDLRQAREAAEQSARTKELFLANMSHEIRTPMNAILGMSRELEKTHLTNEQQFLLDTISKASSHLLVVLNDILDISKIEAGKLSLEHIGFKANDVINRCIQVMAHRAEEKGLELTAHIHGENYPVFLGDPFRLTQVLLNLVSNSIKFTEAGSVTISSSIGKSNGGAETLVITVKDTGIGMDKKFLGQLFDNFVQEENTTSRKYGGTGLGMSITKQLVQLMGGTIYVESEKGNGTEFTLEIPFEKGSEKDLPVVEQEVTDYSILKGKKILLVEDNEMNRLVAATVLNSYDLILDQAVNGKEAIEALQKQSYDLVLMDVQMPVMNGLEATQYIRDHLGSSIPIIALTANAIKGESDRCKMAGMNDFVPKPFEEKELVAAIMRWVDKTLPGKKPDTRETEALYNLVALNKIARGNSSFVSKMINLFIDIVPPAIGDMNRAYRENDYVTVKAIAHKLKPSINNMNILSLKEVLRAIETFDESEKDIREMNALINTVSDTALRVVDQLVTDPARQL